MNTTWDASGYRGFRSDTRGRRVFFSLLFIYSREGGGRGACATHLEGKRFYSIVLSPVITSIPPQIDVPWGGQQCSEALYNTLRLVWGSRGPSGWEGGRGWAGGEGSSGSRR